MKTIQTLTLLLVLFLPLTGFCQFQSLKFGKIDQADLELQACPFDSTAEAMVLDETAQIQFRYVNDKGFQYQYDYTVRIKIFNSDGYEYGTQRIRYYESGKDSKESLSKVKGFCYNLVDGELVKDKLENSEIFTEQISEHWFEMRFTMPKVQDGTIIEYNYTIFSDYISTLRPWQYQREIPVRLSQAEYLLPEFFNYQTIGTGYHPVSENKSYTRQEDFSIRYNAAGPTDIPDYRINQVKSQSNYFFWAAKEVPAIKQEPFMTSVDDYAGKFAFQLISIKYPNSPLKEIMGTYSEFNNTLMESERFGKFIDQKSVFSDAMIEELSAIEDPAERAVKAFEALKRRMNWNESYGIYAGDKAKKIWDEKTGTVSEINLLLVNLYRRVGLDAYPVILSTRSNGKPHPVYPNSDNFNYVVARVKVGDHWALSDATRKSLPFGLLAPSALNGKGWATGPNPDWVSLQSGAESVANTRLEVLIGEDRTVTGILHLKEQGYPAFQKREALSTEEKKAELLTSLEERLGQWTIDSTTWENEGSNYEPLKADIHLSFNGGFRGDRLYLQPIIYGLENENPFKRESRDFPVDMPYGESETFMIIMAISDNYEFEELPEQGIVRMPNNDIELKYGVNQIGNMLSISGTYKVNKLFYSPEEYPTLRQFYTVLLQRIDQPIVIKAKS